MRETGRFVGGVRVLDLAKCGSASAVDGISLVQGLRTCAAFFTFLRANLTLSTSAPCASLSTPSIIDPWDPDAQDLAQLSITTFAPSSPDSSCPSSPTSPSSSSSVCFDDDNASDLDGGGGRRHHHRRTHREGHAFQSTADTLTVLEPLTSPDDKAAGMNLVAASIAQMDHRAAQDLATHPMCLAVLATSCAAAYRFWALHSRPATASLRDIAFLLLLLCTAVATCLAAIRHFTSAYHDIADNARASWLQPDDIVLGARRADTGSLVGVLVLRLEPRVTGKSGGKSSNGSGNGSGSGSGSGTANNNYNNSRRRSARSAMSNLRGGKGVVRAWTTRLGCRDEGIGRDLLGAAVRMTKDRCGRDARVGFAREHANSAMVLPEMFNRGFRRDEMRAAKALDKAIEAWEVERRAGGKLRKRGRRMP